MSQEKCQSGWEYRLEYLRVEDGELHDGQLNALGEDGWELAAAFDGVCIFKRPLLTVVLNEEDRFIARLLERAGVERIREGFLWLPKTIDGERRWLVSARWLERSYVGYWPDGGGVHPCIKWMEVKWLPGQNPPSSSPLPTRWNQPSLTMSDRTCV